jgi:hypothetical protein
LDVRYLKRAHARRHPSSQVVAFPQYTKDQLRDLLLRSAPSGTDAGLYSRFLESLLLASTTKARAGPRVRGACSIERVPQLGPVCWGSAPSISCRLTRARCRPSQVSLCLADLRKAAAQLWPAYVKPLGIQVRLGKTNGQC